ncbi:MAG: hypothetical protein AAB845_00220 [Patescibacteria group bacterium]
MSTTELKPILATREVAIYPDLGEYTIHPGESLAQAYRGLFHDVAIDKRTLTDSVRAKIAIKRTAKEEKSLRIGIIHFPRRDYGSVLRSQAKPLLLEHGYRFGGLGGFLGFVRGCIQIPCPGPVVALGSDMSTGRDVVLGLERVAAKDEGLVGRIFAMRLRNLNIIISQTPAIQCINVIIVRDIVPSN